MTLGCSLQCFHQDKALNCPTTGDSAMSCDASGNAGNSHRRPRKHLDSSGPGLTQIFHLFYIDVKVKTCLFLESKIPFYLNHFCVSKPDSTCQRGSSWRMRSNNPSMRFARPSLPSPRPAPPLLPFTSPLPPSFYSSILSHALPTVA